MNMDTTNNLIERRSNEIKISSSDQDRLVDDKENEIEKKSGKGELAHNPVF